MGCARADRGTAEQYAQVLPIARPQRASGNPFFSEYGAALAQGAREAWQPFLKSTQEVGSGGGEGRGARGAGRGEPALVHACPHSSGFRV